MSKKIKTPYLIPSRWNGYETKKSSLKWEKNFLEVAKEIAAEETAKYGRTIAVPTLLTHLALKDPTFRARYNQKMLNQEKQHSEDHQIAQEFK